MATHCHIHPPPITKMANSKPPTQTHKAYQEMDIVVHLLPPTNLNSSQRST